MSISIVDFTISLIDENANLKSELEKLQLCNRHTTDLYVAAIAKRIELDKTVAHLRFNLNEKSKVNKFLYEKVEAMQNEITQLEGANIKDVVDDAFWRGYRIGYAVSKDSVQTEGGVENEA